MGVAAGNHRLSLSANRERLAKLHCFSSEREVKLAVMKGHKVDDFLNWNPEKLLAPIDEIYAVGLEGFVDISL